jgi:hypothetical protein
MDKFVIQNLALPTIAARSRKMIARSGQRRRTPATTCGLPVSSRERTSPSNAAETSGISTTGSWLRNLRGVERLFVDSPKPSFSGHKHG